ncbi:Hypothetical protein CINCED_3A015712 [Cinara cedri]|uniref:C2H2-type domain-containing protein n=2 Tax=Cinara cedri TaxID=506608 RepID=A0A5E4NKA1_9HEMI|nr:Hypothetical protein CINCED_3A015712 [Cinara cedri]
MFVYIFSFKMTEEYMKKIPFFKLLNLQAINSLDSDSIEISEKYKPIPYSQYTNLFEKNNSIKTGYENFCIQKGTLKLLPFKDFDFIGKHVVCQKCCQKFASKMSYRAHVGTDICIKTFNGPNLIYLKYKNRNCKQTRKTNKKAKFMDDLNSHDKKNILNPEMLNTLQTRNNCYSDNIINQRNKIKEKQINSTDKKYDPSATKPRGRPKKIIDGEPKKRGRPKKFNAVTGSGSSQSDNSIDNNLENDLTEVKTPTIITVGDTYNVNVTETQELQYVMDILTDRFWKLMGAVWKPDTDIIGTIYKIPNGHHNETQNIKEEFSTDLLVNEKEIIPQLESLENDIRLLSNRFEEINEFSNEEELESMLSKLTEIRNEYKEQKLKKTVGINNVSTTDKGKENIECAIKNNEDDTEISKNKNEKGIWLNNDNRGNISSSTITVILNSSNINDESMECIDIKEIKSEPTNYQLISVRELACRYCGKNFASIAEWKMHNSEHLTNFIPRKKYLCKICGHKFKVRKNFMKHLNVHAKLDRTDTKIHYKSLKCGVCHKQYNYLCSYFAHMKTHNK